MPHRHYPPAYLRYVKARLWNLGKPSFWGTAIFLSVVGLVIREYWSNPDVFTYKQNNPVNFIQPQDSSLTAEDKAIAADIDNLPALYSDFEDINLPAITNTSQEKFQAKKSKSLLQDVISKQESSNSLKSNSDLGIVNNAAAPQEQNPFVSQTENLLRFGTLENGSQFSGGKSLNASSELTGAAGTSSRLGIGLVTPTDKSENTRSISPLQAPLNQSSNQSLSSFNGTNSTPPNTLGQTSDQGGIQTSPTNSSSSQTFVPTTRLNTGTGYILQPTIPSPYNNLNSGQPLPNQTFSPTTRLTTGTGYILQPTIPSPYNNLNSGQALPSQTQPASGIPPINSVTPTNVTPYSIQTPNSNVVTPATPVLPGNSDNFIWKQPTQLPQSNLSIPRQISGQYTGVVQK
ncbi:hypothetical protein VB735_06235 [Halotia wernerae UHCC 0503]|nr:hypothetical protein [Halotia wernerae UHCC 0503]